MLHLMYFLPPGYTSAEHKKLILFVLHYVLNPGLSWIINITGFDFCLLFRIWFIRLLSCLLKGEDWLRFGGRSKRVKNEGEEKGEKFPA